MRIHRSAIVNVRRIKEIHPWFGGHYLVVQNAAQELLGDWGWIDTPKTRAVRRTHSRTFIHTVNRRIFAHQHKGRLTFHSPSVR